MGVKDNIIVKHPYPIHTKDYGISNINTHQPQAGLQHKKERKMLTKYM